MKRLVMLMLLAGGLANAEDFSARVRAGKLALSSPLAQKYESTWGPKVTGAMTACHALGFRPLDGAETFTFVGNISPAGLVSSVDVRPSTPVSRCFVEHFNNVQLPPPPPALLNNGRFLPVADELEWRS